MSEALTGIRTLRAKDMIGGRKPVVSRKLKFMTKHVESLLVPRLDEGSNPSISTKKQFANFILQTVFLSSNFAIIS